MSPSGVSCHLSHEGIGPLVNSQGLLHAAHRFAFITLECPFHQSRDVEEGNLFG